MRHPIQIQSFLRNFRSGWKRFWLVPEQHWNITVCIFSLFLVAALLADVWIFWKFAWQLDASIVDPQVSIQSLDRAKFDAVLKSLSDKELEFNSAQTGTAIENIFD